MQFCRRRQPRYSLRGDTPATVEFRFPEGDHGRDFQLAVVDLSASGLGFLTQESLPGLDLGTAIRGVTFRYRDRTIGMDLLVLHLTEEFAGDAVCGCLIYPGSDRDLVTFKELLKDLAENPAGVRATS